jgi:NADP-dependent 3-hydroxy acid dehydrogenase YdfG
MSLKGKVAVITGASAGIGAAVAADLSAAGARLVIMARRLDRLEELAARLGGEVAVFAADIADPATPDKLLAFTLERFGQVDILVNNAGILRIGGLDDFDLDDLAPMIATNYEAPVRTSYVFGRAMKAAGTGSIITISSIGAHVMSPMMSVYGGLKRALENFSECLRIELAGSGVRVGLVAPGTTSTEIFEDMKSDGQPGWDSYITPLQPEDIAQAVRYLVEQPARSNVARMHVYASADAH